MKRFIIPSSILLGCVILGGFFYASQINKQKSIEKQKQMDLVVQQDELKAKEEAAQLKVEQDKKEYIVKRKKDCYDLENSEREKWSNVVDSNYSETEDICIVRYKDLEPKSDLECDEKYPTSTIYFLADNWLCKSGEFKKEF